MSELVHRLSVGQHPVEISLRPERTLEAFKECLDRGYVHVKFTGTRGGTELGIQIDPERSNLAAADFDRRTGSLTIAGDLSLDFIDVRCVAEINLPSMEGQGHLEILDSTQVA